jgi:cytoskeletal protein RodZ
MKLFRRKSSTTSNVPPEVAEYYQAERRDRTGMAWLMTLFALLLTVIIVLGLFLAGRWLYRTVRGDDVPTVTTTQNQGGSEQAKDGSVEPSESNRDNDSASPTEETTREPESSQNSTDSREPSSTAPSREPETQSPATNEPEARDGGETTKTTQDELANTGPGETAAALFVVVTVAIYAARTLRLQKR